MSLKFFVIFRGGIMFKRNKTKNLVAAIIAGLMILTMVISLLSAAV